MGCNFTLTNKLIGVFAILVIPFVSLAQIDNKLIEEISEREALQKNQKEAYQLRTQIPLRIFDGENNLAEIDFILPNGKPVFKVSNNNGAANTLGTNKLRQGGGLGLNLSGLNMIIGEWDQDAVLSTHQELNGRVVQRDNATAPSRHATHVAGTLIASGVIASARGMAPSATLWAHDWNNDQSEMAIAASEGLKISNHSYGIISGWHPLTNFVVAGTAWYWFGDSLVNDTIDAAFGYYNSTSRQWDQIAAAAPDYLIVKSSGNDNNQGPAPGTNHYYFSPTASNWVASTATRLRDGAPDGYDCMSFSSVSKNILTVGSAAKVTNYSGPASVILASSSSTGPTDDGRIKPDVVGAGVSLYSSSNTGNADYATLSGTSMAAPNVAGSLLLVQEHANNVLNKTIKAYTLKGLAIHTAKEAGLHPGPDYKHGWGLVDVEAAVNLISNQNTNRLIEEQIANNVPRSYYVYADGNSPLRATIVWNDVPSNPRPFTFNDRTPILVNDLDMRIIRVNDGNTFSPWVLNPNQPSAAATNGDNFRDNVEQVLINNPTAGWYKIEIKHKRTLSGGNQPFALLISGIKTSEVQAVNLPSKICPGQTTQINFLTSLPQGTSRQFLLELSDSLGNFANPIQVGSATTTAQTANINCNIPLAVPPGNGYKFRIRVASLSLIGLPSTNLTVDACNPIQVTLRPEDCGRMNFLVGGPVGIDNNVIYAETGIAKVNKYRFICFDNNGNYIGDSTTVNRFIPIVSLGNINWGRQYVVRVQVETSTSGWSAMGAPCTIGTATLPSEAPSIAIRPILCNTNKFNPSSATNIGGIDIIQAERNNLISNYQFEVVDANTSQLLAIIDRGNANLFIRNYPSVFQHGGSYQIRVRAFLGTIVGSWSPSCIINTIPSPLPQIPLTAIDSRFCGTSLFTLAGTSQVSGIDFMMTNRVLGASGYDIEVRDASGVRVLAILPTNTNGILYPRNHLSVFNWATKYQIRARVHMNSAVGQWGQSCIIEIAENPALVVPNLSTRIRQCGETVNLYTFLRANSITGASAYRFRFYLNAAATQIARDDIQNSPNYFLTGLSPNTYYVTVVAIVGGVETSLLNGDTCAITLLPVSKFANNTSTIKNFPNPFNETFTLDLGNNDIQLVRIVDLQGRLITSFEPNQQAQFLLGGEWASGLYLMQFIYTDGRKEVNRVIKTQ